MNNELIAFTESVAQHYFAFTEWVGEHYMKFHGGWMLKYSNEIKGTLYSTETLYQRFRNIEKIIQNEQ